MKKYSACKSGIFNPRALVATALCAIGASFAFISFAATPGSGTLTPTSGPLTYTAGPFLVANPSAQATGTPTCTGSAQTGQICDNFQLTVNAASVAATKNIMVQIRWQNSAADFDLYVLKGGALVKKSASSADPETVIIDVPADGTVYVVRVAPFNPLGQSFTGTISLVDKPPGPQTATGLPPRYQSFPAGEGQSDDAGEPSIGVDWNPNVATLKHDKVNTGGVAFFTSGDHEWRVNFDDCASPANYNWEDVSALFDKSGVLGDPIGFVDHYTSVELGTSYPPPHTPGRVFAMQLIGGEGNSASGYSDDDGGNYLPGGNGGPGQGPDHETLGGGPYRGTPPPTANYPATGTKNAIYYCSQNIVAEAQCSRSDTGGQTFGPAVPIFTPTQCLGGIHGHLKVAPDGTVYVPNSTCGTTGNNGVAVSTDNGVTWTENNVPGSTGNQDPSVGIGQNNVGKPGTNAGGTNTIYLGWVSGDGHPHIAHSGDRGVTYTGDTDVGLAFGVTRAVFPVVVAGDDNRAAFAFLGTGNGISTDANPCDPYGAVLNCKNIWHLYIATTYDGGGSWVTIDATPNDPVQTGTVCLEGTTCAGGRNLLDFNDFTVDAQGRGLVAFADGCVNCSNTFQAQSAAEHGTISRQSGGRRLFAFFDPTEPAAPAAPQLLKARAQQNGSALISWLEPDNGGSPITGYKVYRGTMSGTETFLADVVGAANTKYADPAPPTGNVFYYVTAINENGESTHCRELMLIALPPCIQPTGPFLDDLEPTADPGWEVDTAKNDAGPASQTWQVITDPNAHSAMHSYFSDASTVQPKDDRLIAPPQNVSATTHLTFWHRFQFEDGFDGGVLEVSTDNGDTWVDVVAGGGSFVSGGYNGSIDPGFGSAIAGRPAWTGGDASGSMTKVEVNLGAFAGINIKVRFRLVTDFLETPGVGWFIDDIGFNNLQNCPILLSTVVSRKTHYNTDFDVVLPIVGDAGVEPRVAGDNDSFTLIYTFNAPITAPGTASIAEGTAAQPSTALGPLPGQVTVNLTGVTDAQRLVIDLTGVQGQNGRLANSITIPMIVLAGDTDGDTRVNIVDTNQTKSFSGQTTNLTNFRTDVNIDGRINIADVNFVKNHSGHSVAPPAPPVPKQQRSR
jgi:hypothetical protein